MDIFKASSVVSIVLLLSAAPSAQDPAKVDSAHYKVVLDNPTVRVLKVDYPAGGKSPMHQHPDAMVVALTNAKVRFTMPDGKSEEMALANESVTFTPAGAHSGTILGTERVEAVIVEFKAKPGTATIPTTREGQSMKVLAESPQALAYRTTADPSFAEPAGSKHDFAQVAVMLGPTQMSLSLDGKPAKTTWSRGDVVFIGRGVPHESKNIGGKPADYIIVAIK